MNVKDKKLLRKRKQEKKIYETKNVLNKKKSGIKECRKQRDNNIKA